MRCRVLASLESACKVFLAPRAGAGEPTVVVTRAEGGLLLAAVSCDCPIGGACKRHNADDLLRRARDHHKATAPLLPCAFSMNPRVGQANVPLKDVRLHQPAPTTSPYAPASEASVVAADPALVKPGKLWMITYMPACTMGPPAVWDPADPRGPPVPLRFAQGLDFEFVMQ